MAHWMAGLGLVAFGAIGMFSIGRPLLLVGLAMLVLGPLRNRPALFWAPLAAVIAWNVGYLAIAPFYCTTTQTIGADSPVAGDAMTRCSSLLGVIYSGDGSYNPSLEPANQAGFLLAGITFVVVLAVTLWKRRARHVDTDGVPLSFDWSDLRVGDAEAVGSRPASIAAAGLGAAVDVGYMVVVQSQGSDLGSRVVFFATFIAVMSILSLAGPIIGRWD